MLAKQLTVFIENRTGRLSEVLSVLKTGGVNIISMSLADTTEYGLLRLIVDDPARGKEKLSDGGFSSLLSDVAIIKIEHKVGSLQSLLEIIDNKKVNIEYMYGLSVDGDNAYVVLKASDLAALEEILKENGIETVCYEQLIGI